MFVAADNYENTEHSWSKFFRYSQSPDFTPHCKLMHPVACVMKEASRQIHVKLDATHDVWFKAVEKHLS
jgi:hypothetical protein